MAVISIPLSFYSDFYRRAITRYISFEGMMLIREGETSNQIVSEKQYFKIQIEDKGDILNYEDVPYIMSPLHHDFNATYDFRRKVYSENAGLHPEKERFTSSF